VDIGPEMPPFIAEPLEDPFAEPVREPDEVPAPPEPVREPVPAGRNRTAASGDHDGA
jgi:hypothetical protein